VKESPLLKASVPGPGRKPRHEARLSPRWDPRKRGLPLSDRGRLPGRESRPDVERVHGCSVPGAPRRRDSSALRRTILGVSLATLAGPTLADPHCVTDARRLSPHSRRARRARGVAGGVARVGVGPSLRRPRGEPPCAITDARPTQRVDRHRDGTGCVRVSSRRGSELPSGPRTPPASRSGRGRRETRGRNTHDSCPRRDALAPCVLLHRTAVGDPRPHRPPAAGLGAAFARPSVGRSVFPRARGLGFLRVLP
jgi:hypothetical protein